MCVGFGLNHPGPGVCLKQLIPAPSLATRHFHRPGFLPPSRPSRSVSFRHSKCRGPSVVQVFWEAILWKEKEEEGKEHTRQGGLNGGQGAGGRPPAPVWPAAGTGGGLSSIPFPGGTVSSAPQGEAAPGPMPAAPKPVGPAGLTPCLPSPFHSVWGGAGLTGASLRPCPQSGGWASVQGADRSFPEGPRD